MKKNYPVTTVERFFPEHEVLISETDLKGRIKTANASFCHVAGFSEEELIGKNHNVVRHPDMPAAAFEDLWKTVQAGQQWEGLVKNRCANGDFYWVKARVTPVYEDGVPVGYRSVRKKPSRDEVVAAENLYSKLNANSQLKIDSIGVRRKSVGVLGHIKICHAIYGLSVLTVLNGLLTYYASQHYPEYTEICLGALSGLTFLTAFKVSRIFEEQFKTIRYGLTSFGNGNIAANIRLYSSNEFGELAKQFNFATDVVESCIGDTSQAMQALAAGEFNRRIVSTMNGNMEQLKVSINSSIDNLKSLVNAIKVASDSILTSVGEIAAGNTDLSQRTEQQAASLEETAASMDELATTVKNNAENAILANKMATNSSSIANSSSAAILEMITTMGTILDSSNKINEIISVIDSIAFQTNILALNASVEAARAGEQGKGFAVVAGEVRSLAQKTATAAKEIKQLLQDSNDKVKHGSHLVHNAGSTITELANSVNKMKDMMDEISSASVEQSMGIEQINIAISQMDSVTQQNAALVEESAAASTSLEEQAQMLMESVRIFKVANDDDQSVLAKLDRLAVVSSIESRLKTEPRKALKKPDITDFENKGANWEKF